MEKERKSKATLRQIKTPKLTGYNIHHIPIIKFLRNLVFGIGLEHAHCGARHISRDKGDTNMVEMCKLLKLLD